MRLSRRARYALWMMVEFARESNGGQNKVSLTTVSKKTNISRRYLEQLAMAMKNASLIHGISGKGGGYLLSRPPGDIKVGQIVEAAIGPINIVECVQQPDLCIQAEFCGCREIYERINTGIHGVLSEFSLADLASMGLENAGPPGAEVAPTGCPTG